MPIEQHTSTYIQTVEYVEDYDPTALREAIDREFSFLQIEKDLKPEMKILIKPNLVGDYNPAFAATTHPAVVAAVADWLTAHGCRNIVIADSPGGALSVTPGFAYDSFYERVNYHTLEKNGVRLNRDKGWGVRQSPAGCQNRSFHLLNAVLEADYIINIAKLKTHNITGISFGIKNLFGCVPDIQKPVFHARYPRQKDFNNMFVELAMTVAPSLTVVDGIVAMEGNGPVAGKKRQLGMLFAAKDVFSQDCFIAKLLGLDPSSVEMLCAAKRKGLLHCARVRSRSFEPVRNIAPLVLPDIKRATTAQEKMQSRLRLLLRKKDEWLMQVSPVYVPQKCSMCLRCVNSCPVHAITVENNTLHFHTQRCIGCLCCHEICSNQAITVQKKLKIRAKK